MFSRGFPTVFPRFSHCFGIANFWGGGVRAVRAEEPGGFQSGQEEMGLVRGLEGPGPPGPPGPRKWWGLVPKGPVVTQWRKNQRTKLN